MGHSVAILTTKQKEVKVFSCGCRGWGFWILRDNGDTPLTVHMIYWIAILLPVFCGTAEKHTTVNNPYMKLNNTFTMNFSVKAEFYKKKLANFPLILFCTRIAEKCITTLITFRTPHKEIVEMSCL